MSSLALNFNEDNIFTLPPISPYVELGAYESLWLKKGASFKSLAEEFSQLPESLPSDFVPRSEAIKCSKQVYEELRSNGISNFGIRINHAADYPQKLRDAQHPVELLYFRGIWEFAESKCVSVVGTRNPSPDGIRRAKQLTKKLVERDYTIVSGLAKGIDTVAHKTAIEAGGRTIAVIGTAIHKVYPQENSRLQNHIANEHLLISPVPILRYLKQNPLSNRFFFSERNKLMSAICNATIIVEAGDSSGTLTQARAAQFQKRKLFILDSCFQRPDLSWPYRFARQGAIRVKQTEDIWRNLD